MSSRSDKSGFTRVEIGIVLVVFGLLIGGWVKGHEVVEDAKYEKFKEQIESYRAAVIAFQDQYQALPGDFDLASTKLSAPVGVTIQNGNGNGSVGGGYCSTANEEACVVWQHLILAGLIPGDASATDMSARRFHSYGGVISSVSTGDWANNKNELKILMQGVPGEVAQRLDNELDGGNATSGNVARYSGSGSTYDQAETLELFVSL